LKTYIHNVQPTWIPKVGWIVHGVSIEICIPTIKSDRIFGCPPSRSRIIVTGPKAHEPGVLIIEPAGEAEGLEAGIGVEQDVAALVIVHSLHGEAGGGLEDHPRAAQVI